MKAIRRSDAAASSDMPASASIDRGSNSAGTSRSRTLSWASMKVDRKPTAARITRV